jgi:hypothetical protein
MTQDFRQKIKVQGILNMFQIQIHKCLLSNMAVQFKVFVRHRIP